MRAQSKPLKIGDKLVNKDGDEFIVDAFGTVQGKQAVWFREILKHSSEPGGYFWSFIDEVGP